jgi:hypothetical protein
MKNESDLEDDKENDVLDQDSVRMIKRFEKELILFNMYKVTFYFLIIPRKFMLKNKLHLKNSLKRL